MIVDTGGLLAAFNDRHSDHEAVRSVLDGAKGPRWISPFVVQELDYLLHKRLGIRAEVAFLRDVERSAYRLVDVDSSEVGRCRKLIERYSDLGIGLADASLVVIAERLVDRDLVTFDQKHFRVLPGPGGHPFRLLPADS